MMTPDSVSDILFPEYWAEKTFIIRMVKQVILLTLLSAALIIMVVMAREHIQLNHHLEVRQSMAMFLVSQ